MSKPKDFMAESIFGGMSIAIMGLGFLMFSTSLMEIYERNQLNLPPTLQCPFEYPVPKPAPRCINDITEFCT